MKAKVLTGLVFCLCLGTLFLSVSLFVNTQTTPKRYFSLFMDGTHVEPLKAKPGQDTVSEQTTPETLLPP
jgi:hypothetical protein